MHTFPQEMTGTFEPPKDRGSLPWSIRLLIFYLAAITIFGKGPTYLGIPPVFLGEVTLFVCLVWMVNSWSVWGLPSRMFTVTTGLIALFVIYGFVHMLSDIPRYGLLSVRDSACWYYALFFFIGLQITSNRLIANKVWRWLQYFWIAALIWNTLPYGIRNFIISSGPKIYWRNTPLLLGSGSENLQQMFMGAVIIMLGIKNLKPMKIQIIGIALEFTLVFTAIYNVLRSNPRGVKIAILTPIIIAIPATIFSRRGIWPQSRWFVILCVSTILLLSIAIASGPSGINRYISKNTRLSRFSNLATPEGAFTRGTARWRWLWWQNILEELHRENPVTGLGFGLSLSIYTPMVSDELKYPVRSPHNFNVTILSRMGYFGAGVWAFILVLGIGSLLLCIRKGRLGNNRYTLERHKELIFWFIFISCTWLNASFNVLMEGPVLGIWFWFALGFALGRSRDEHGTEAPKETMEDLAWEDDNRLRFPPPAY